MASDDNDNPVRLDPLTKNATLFPAHDEPIAPSPRRIVDKQSTEYMIKSGIAGGLAGCAAKTVVGPLDRVKILFQTSNPQFAKYTGSWFGAVDAMKTIYSSDGTRGLFRGHSATLLRIFPYAGIKFLAYEQVRASLIKDRSQETAARRFMSGSIAGTISVFFTYPLEVIRVRLAFETKGGARASYADICRQIYHEHPPRPSTSGMSSSSLPSVASTAVTAVQDFTPSSGFINFYRGFTPTLWGMLPYAGASFLTHDSAGDLLRRPRFAPYTTLPNTATTKKPAQLTSWAQLIAGGLAGFVSQTVSYPLEVVRRRMQVGGAVGDGRRSGMAETANKIYLERGWRGFFVGLSIGYVKVVPLASVSFYVYERGKFYLGI